MYKGKRSGYKGRGSGYKGRESGYTGRGNGCKGRGSGYKGRGVGVRGGGIQHQEYIMTFNEVLNTIVIGTHTVLSCFISLPILNLILFFITCVYNFLCCSASW